MPESAHLPEFSRRRLLLSGLVAVPAATVLAATAGRPGPALAASAQAPRPSWPGAGSAPDASRAYFC
jgi:hypothetical protein